MKSSLSLQALGLGLLLIQSATDVSAGASNRVSLRSSGVQGNAASLSPALSADGNLVVFQSDASNLVRGDRNGRTDIFLHDRTTHTTTRISLATDGGEANDISGSPAISGDGRVAAFWSSATNLTGTDTNPQPDVFVRDLVDNTTTKVSISSLGEQGDNSSSAPALSHDGNIVAFQSVNTKLVENDTKDMQDVFVHDRMSHETTRISVDSAGAQADGNSFSPSLSDDGRYVAFTSEASNLVADDTNGVSDIFLHDRQTGETRRISFGFNGKETRKDSDNPVLSGNGRFVAYTSAAGNLVEGDTNDTTDTFVYDTQTAQTHRVSLPSLGLNGVGGSTGERPSISADGRYVAFGSGAFDLVLKDRNGMNDIFVHDRDSGETSLISVSTPGGRGNGSSSYPVLSANGQIVAYYSDASSLVPGDTNGAADVFVHDRFAKGNLAVRLSANRMVVTRDRFVRYDIEAMNQRPRAVSGVRVTDVVPTSMEFDSAGAGCLYDTDTRTVTCTLGMLKANASATTHIRLKGIQKGPVTNAVNISGDLLDKNTNNNRKTVTVTVQ